MKYSDFGPIEGYILETVRNWKIEQQHTIFGRCLTGWRGDFAQVVGGRCCCECQCDNYGIHWSWLVNVQPVKIAEFVWTPHIITDILKWPTSVRCCVYCPASILRRRSWMRDCFCLFCSNALWCTSGIYCMQTFSVFYLSHEDGMHLHSS